MEGPPDYSVAATVHAMLTPEESCRPVYADLAQVHLEIERDDQAYAQRVMRRCAKQALREPERSLEPIENKVSSENTNIEKPTSN
jgi:hypothetical protein